MIASILNWVLAASLLAALTDGPPATPALVPETSKVDFGTVLVGASAARSFRMTSRNGSVTLRGAYLDGGERRSFALDYRRRGHLRHLGSGRSVMVSVAFSPMRPQAHRSSILARMSSGELQGFPVALRGAGTYFIARAGDLRVTAGEASARTPLGFGTATAGTDRARHITVRNLGSGSLKVTMLPPGVNSGFRARHDLEISLAPGEQRRLRIEFSPLRSGDHLAALRFRDVEGHVAGVTLSGIGKVDPAR